MAAAPIGVAGLAFGAANIKIVPSVSSDDLTVAIKTAAGNDPSDDDPVFISFRDTSTPSGEYYILRIADPLSITIAQSAMNKFQTRDGIPFRLWVGIFDVDGTPHVGLTNCLLVDASNESVEIRSLANISTRNAVTGSSGVGSIRSDQVITAKPFRVVGWMAWEDGLTTAGTWDEEPTETHLIGKDSKWPGDVIADKRQQKEGGASNTGTIPFDGTTPQSGEGTLYASVLMEPTSKTNVVETYFSGYVSHSVADTIVTVATFINSESDARDSGLADIRDVDKIGRVDVTNRFIINDGTLVGGASAARRPGHGI